MAQLNFDATQVAPDTGFETVPAGWYNVRITESEMKPTKDGAGAYLQLTFDIIDGQYMNRKLFARLNLHNNSQVAKEIAYKQLSAIAHAVGILHVQDSQQLHGIPLKVKVKVRTDKTGEYDDSNDITSYKNINETVPAGGLGVTGAGAAPASTPPAAAPQGWGAPPPAQHAPPAQPPQQPAPPAGQPNGWGAPPPAQGQPGGWGAPPLNGQPPQTEMQWGAPPQNPGPGPSAPQPGPGPQGGPPPAQPGWSPPPNGQPWGAPPAGTPAPQPQHAPPSQPQGAPAAPHPAQTAQPPWSQPR
jgi:hypothetical protein